MLPSVAIEPGFLGRPVSSLVTIPAATVAPQRGTGVAHSTDRSVANSAAVFLPPSECV
jgi:hypothetical protein